MNFFGLDLFDTHEHLPGKEKYRPMDFDVLAEYTGLQKGNGNFTYHSEPFLLSITFMVYPNLKCDIFHIGYPYQHMLLVLVNKVNNVPIEFYWFHIISPSASVHALIGYLDRVPANKILGFGSDNSFIDGVYGHQYIAREIIARTLAMQVRQGACSMDETNTLADLITHRNTQSLLNIEKEA